MNKSMNINQLCTSLPLSKRLKELMPNYKSLFYWNEPNISHGWDDWHISDSEFGHGSISLPAPTSSELMDILPCVIAHGGRHHFLNVEKEENSYAASYQWFDGPEACNSFSFYDESESLPDALALLLIHIIEQGLWKPKNTK